MIETPLIRVVDDDREFRNSQKRLLEKCRYEAAAYESAADFLEHDQLSRPGCIILDVRMPGMTGMELQEELRRRRAAALPIIFLTGHGSIDMAVAAMQRGASVFLQKPADPDRLLAEVHRAVALSLRLASEERELAELRSRVARLSGRELEVARLVARGLQNKEIARSLGIEESTVKMHRAGALAKLGGSSADITRIFTVLEIRGGGR